MASETNVKNKESQNKRRSLWRREFMRKDPKMTLLRLMRFGTCL